MRIRFEAQEQILTQWQDEFSNVNKKTSTVHSGLVSQWVWRLIKVYWLVTSCDPVRRKVFYIYIKLNKNQAKFTHDSKPVRPLETNLKTNKRILHGNKLWPSERENVQTDI